VRLRVGVCSRGLGTRVGGSNPRARDPPTPSDPQTPLPALDTRPPTPDPYRLHGLPDHGARIVSEGAFTRPAGHLGLLPSAPVAHGTKLHARVGENGVT
jgi:hypothetical protein